MLHIRNRAGVRIASLLIAAAMFSGCSTKGGSSAVGAGIGAVVGGVAGYVIGGEKGALVGAGAGALLGAGAGYVLTKKEEKQTATEADIKAASEAEGTAIEEPILNVVDVTIAPEEIPPGQEIALSIALRAVSGTEQTLLPPTVSITLTRDGKELRKEELTAENTGDVSISTAMSIPKSAEPGVYTVVVETQPQAGLTPSRVERNFEVLAKPQHLASASQL